MTLDVKVSFPVLVTTALNLSAQHPISGSVGLAGGVHTVVLTFDSKDAADQAVMRINNRNSYGFHPIPTQVIQSALPLY